MAETQFIDKRLPEGSKVWTDLNSLRWNFLFGGLFVPEMPEAESEQPTMGGEPGDTPEDNTQSGQSQNITESGDARGNGDVNPDLDDERNKAGESDEESDSDEDGDSDSDGDIGEYYDDPELDNLDFEPEADPNDFGYSKPETGDFDNIPALNIYVDEQGKTNYERNFESWSEFVNCAGDLTLRQWTHSTMLDTEEKRGGTYYATETLSQAIDMALFSGWPKGRDMLIDSMAQVVPTNAFRVHHELDVAGGVPMVPVYCAGDPACMVNFEVESLKNSRPIVRIDYNNVCAFYIKADAMMKMGAAVLSFAQTLEASGFSTELRIVGNTQSKGDIFRYNVVYKQAGEPLDLDRAAFAVAHPSTMRRFALGLMEQDRRLQHFGPAGHGSIMHTPNDPTSGTPNGAIFIKPASRNYTDISECTKIVEEAANHILTQLTERKILSEAAD